MLLGLMLGASLLVIAAAAMAPTIAMQIKRDREEELIHRGMQYRRAIHTFAKRTGRFPLRIEELEGTNGTRYLRKRYKDPISGKDFRLLHMADIAATGARLNTASPPTDGSADASASQSGASPDVSSADTQADQNAPAAGVAGSPPAQTANSSASGTEFGGGVIYGVASPSAKKSIREFDHKSHYNQWLFFYSTIYDGSVEVKGPTPLRPVFASQASSNSTNPSDQTSVQSSPQ